MRRYRVALVGCRSRGVKHALGITNHPRMKLVAVCDVLPERLEAVGDQFGVTARYADFRQMIEREKPDIVNIATATKFHASLAQAALEMGCHVDVEKPMTLTLEELDALMAAQRSSGKQLVTHHQAALHPPATKLREMVSQGVIGEPRVVRIRGKGYYGGFGLFQMQCHPFALAITVVGPARAVSAHMVTAGRPTTVDDIYEGPLAHGLTAGEHITGLYELRSGASLISEDDHRGSVDSSTARFEVVGTEGALALDWAVARALYHTAEAHWRPTTEWKEVRLSERERTVAGHVIDHERLHLGVEPAHGPDIWQADEWVRALDEGRDHLINADVGAGTMEMLLGAYASHAEGRRIELPQSDRTDPLQRWLTREGRPSPPPAPREYGEWIDWASAQDAEARSEPRTAVLA